VSGEGVQQALLKIIEGTRANISPRGSKKYGQSDMVQLDTTNILFICGGSFTGIESIIGRRTGSRGIGFGSELKEKQEKKIGEVLKDLRPEDLTKFGLIPEFVGRVPVISTLDELTADDLRHILTEPKNALVKQYKKLFALDRVELEFDDDAIDAMVEEAIKRDSGARGLRTILESAMLDIMYEVPYLEGIQSCRISRAVIEERGEPILTFKKKKSA
ncbi:AAA family ATPase, partial [Myxococcota bacterium]|nr:AAA family ATPase [Myxococcota bacterium]